MCSSLVHKRTHPVHRLWITCTDYVIFVVAMFFFNWHKSYGSICPVVPVICVDPEHGNYFCMVIYFYFKKIDNFAGLITQLPTPSQKEHCSFAQENKLWPQGGTKWQDTGVILQTHPTKPLFIHNYNTLLCQCQHTVPAPAPSLPPHLLVPGKDLS